MSHQLKINRNLSDLGGPGVEELMEINGEAQLRQFGLASCPPAREAAPGSEDVHQH